MQPVEERDYRAITAEDSFAWAYYKSKMFSPDANWTLYLSDRGLYKKTRLVFNPVPSLVNFYVDNVWGQARNADFPALATPLLKNTDEKITAAIAQIDQWTNWLSESQKIKRYCAASGSVLIEVDDDLYREKVLHRTYWHGFVTDLQLNTTGDVLSYTIEYDAYDRLRNRSYVFKKEVTKENIKYYYNNSPFIPEGKDASIEENPYGFCAAVWIKHKDDGGIKGIPACEDFAKVDYANSLASHLHDNIHKEIESGKILGLEDPASIRVLTGGSQNADGTINEVDPRLERVLLAAKGNVSVNDLSGLLKLAEAHPYLKDLLISFADDYPELEYRQILKDNPSLSGVALERLLTPAQNRLDGVQANYNQQLTKLRQMQLAIGGWRTRNGWKRKTRQQALFNPFDLESYERGDLDFYIAPSLLIEESEDDREDLLTKKAARAKTLEGVVNREEQARIAGYSEDEIAEVLGVAE